MHYKYKQSYGTQRKISPNASLRLLPAKLEHLVPHALLELAIPQHARVRLDFHTLLIKKHPPLLLPLGTRVLPYGGVRIRGGGRVERGKEAAEGAHPEGEGGVGEGGGGDVAREDVRRADVRVARVEFL